MIVYLKCSYFSTKKFNSLNYVCVYRKTIKRTNNECKYMAHELTGLEQNQLEVNISGLMNVNVER